MYNEKNTSWYLRTFPAKYFNSYNQFIKGFGMEIPKYIKFAPGSNYIVRKENIQKHPKSFYEQLRHCVDYSALPGEAQIIERFLYTLWTSDRRFEAEMLLLNPRNKFVVLTEKVLIFFYKKYLKSKSYILNTGSKLFNYVVKKFKKTTFGFLSKVNTFFYQNSSIKEIAAYRKKIKKYDVFIFFNELDLLELRLEILGEYVDYFVIVESTVTFSGNPKPLYYNENKERFKKWAHKIIHHVVDDTPQSDIDNNCDQEILTMANKSPNVPKGQIHWLREFYQKEMMKKPLVNQALDEDICFISDIDEIWNPKVIIDCTKDRIFKFVQKVYVYYLNNRSSEAWMGTLATKYKNIKNKSVNHLDTPSIAIYTYIENGGWHFTNIGGAEKIKQKIESYGHQEFNTEKIKSMLDEQIKHNKDFIGRNFKFWTDESDLPKYILDNKGKYKNLFKR
jgi:beta-1,4-mannosyl-glycoprotein beta-1,4-N-acetylglucosaminyltransferase